MSKVSMRDVDMADAAMMASLARRTFAETLGHLYSRANLEAFLAGHSEEAWQDDLADPRFEARLAETGGEPIGFVAIGRPNLPFAVDEENSVELRMLYVLAPWHGKGVAPVLMQWAVERARERGAGALFLSVFIDNRRARAFYTRYGLAEIGPYAFKVGTHEDQDIVMRLGLEQE